MILKEKCISSQFISQAVGWTSDFVIKLLKISKPYRQKAFGISNMLWGSMFTKNFKITGYEIVEIGMKFPGTA